MLIAPSFEKGSQLLKKCDDYENVASRHFLEDGRRHNALAEYACMQAIPPKVTPLIKPRVEQAMLT